MSVQITNAFVEQYKGNVEHLVQQKGSRLRDCVSVESVTGKNAYFEQIGSTAAQVRTSRHSDTPRMDTPHSRRRVSLADYDWSDLIVGQWMMSSSPLLTAPPTRALLVELPRHTILL